MLSALAAVCSHLAPPAPVPIRGPQPPPQGEGGGGWADDAPAPLSLARAARYLADSRSVLAPPPGAVVRRGASNEPCAPLDLGSPTMLTLALLIAAGGASNAWALLDARSVLRGSNRRLSTANFTQLKRAANDLWTLWPSTATPWL